jgi:hypothetical protein
LEDAETARSFGMGYVVPDSKTLWDKFLLLDGPLAEYVTRIQAANEKMSAIRGLGMVIAHHMISGHDPMQQSAGIVTRCSFSDHLPYALAIQNPSSPVTIGLEPFSDSQLVPRLPDTVTLVEEPVNINWSLARPLSNQIHVI